nr:hypothetical protein [Tanacetum cinerariifolium]
MPTWCHMFNSTLTGSARVWFDDLPPESVDSYDDLKKAFLANFLQPKKCIKDPIEIHHIKQREGESTEDIVIYDKISGRSRGFGFVTMSAVEEVEEAVRKFNGYELDGRAIRVNSGPPPRREESSFGGSREGGRGGGRSFDNTNRVSADEVNNAIDSLNGVDLDGRNIRVSVAEAPQRRQF